MRIDLLGKSIYSLWISFVFLALMHVSGFASDTVSNADSTMHSNTGTADSLTTGSRIYDYVAYPTLQMLSWPVEKGLVPLVKALTYPSRAPIRYFLNENVIDRTRNLISFGQNDQILFYPTINLAPGTASRIGLTLRDNALFGRKTERLVAYGLYYVNGDYSARTYVTASNILETEFFAKVGVRVVRMKNAFVNQPETNAFLFYSDSSEQYQFQMRHPLFLDFQAFGELTLRQNRLYSLNSAPPCASCTNIPLSNSASNFFNSDTGAQALAYRGIGQTFLDRVWQLGLSRDTRNNENIPLVGSWMDLSWRYHQADLGHSYQEWSGQYTKYFKLGKEHYEISSEEERRRGGMSMKKFIRQLDYENLRNELFSRKVIVLHGYAAQSFEIPGNSMPIYGLQTLGNNSPLRGYVGNRFRDYTVASFSAEYRFPILRLMDGTLFDEYGVHGRSWDNIDFIDYKNSWGFGIRVRRPDIYLFRMEIGFHGLSGAAFNMSVDEPF